MSEAIELKIQRLLLESEDQERVADTLLKEWDHDKLSETEARAVGYFLVNTGLAPSLLERINRQLNSERTVFWEIYSLIAAQASKHLDIKSLKSIVDGATEQGVDLALLYDEKLAEKSDSIKQAWTKYKSLLMENYEERQIELIDQIQFLSTQRLIEEEKKALSLLDSLNPSSNEYGKLVEDFENRWARHILNLKQSVETTYRLTLKIRDDWHRQMGKTFAPLFESLEEASKKTPESTLDLALTAYFMDFTNEAMNLLETATPSESRDWLLAELFLENRRYIDLLEWTDQLGLKYADLPESTFAVSYLKAKAFWGLGQPALAIDLITSIIQVRPNYRSASTLLQEWQGGGQ